MAGGCRAELRTAGRARTKKAPSRGGHPPMTDLFEATADALTRDGFAFVRAREMGALLETRGLRDWGSFAAGWNDLGVDTYMADGGRYRRRRFAAFRAGPGGIVGKPHHPPFQTRHSTHPT